MLSTGPRRNKVRTSDQHGLRWRIATWAVLLVVAACRPDPASPRGAAERFLDAHYVAIDLAAALPLTTGLAQTKIHHEAALIGDEKIDAATRKPQVWYRLLDERPLEDGGVQLAYLGTVSPEGMERFERRWLVTVREQPGGWIVSNYEELPD
jgi:hypothetical protein